VSNYIQKDTIAGNQGRAQGTGIATTMRSEISSLAGTQDEELKMRKLR